MPHDIAWPQLRENFMPVMQQGLRRHGLSRLHQMLDDGSILVDLGYVDPDELRRAAAAADAAVARDIYIEPSLHELLALEQGLTTLLG